MTKAKVGARKMPVTPQGSQSNGEAMVEEGSSEQAPAEFQESTSKTASECGGSRYVQKSQWQAKEIFRSGTIQT